jgi:hypothetical protein
LAGSPALADDFDFAARSTAAGLAAFIPSAASLFRAAADRLSGFAFNLRRRGLAASGLRRDRAPPHAERHPYPGVDERWWDEPGERKMRLISVALLAAAGLALAVPASAEELRVRAPGVGISVGTGHHHDRIVTERRRVVVDDDDSYARARCKTTIIKTDGMTKKIKKCR